MPLHPRPTHLGTSGAAPISVDATAIGPAVTVTLTAPYARQPPPGFPTPPGLTGAPPGVLAAGAQTIPAGTTLVLHQAEAAALVAAGVAVPGAVVPAAPSVHPPHAAPAAPPPSEQSIRGEALARAAGIRSLAALDADLGAPGHTPPPAPVPPAPVPPQPPKSAPQG